MVHHCLEDNAASLDLPSLPCWPPRRTSWSRSCTGHYKCFDDMLRVPYRCNMCHMAVDNILTRLVSRNLFFIVIHIQVKYLCFIHLLLKISVKNKRVSSYTSMLFLKCFYFRAGTIARGRWFQSAKNLSCVVFLFSSTPSNCESLCAKILVRISYCRSGSVTGQWELGNEWYVQSRAV